MSPVYLYVSLSKNLGVLFDTTLSFDQHVKRPQLHSFILETLPRLDQLL